MRDKNLVLFYHEIEKTIRRNLQKVKHAKNSTMDDNQQHDLQVINKQNNSNGKNCGNNTGNNNNNITGGNRMSCFNK